MKRNDGGRLTEAELKELAKMWRKPTKAEVDALIKKHGKKYFEKIAKKVEKIAKG